MTKKRVSLEKKLAGVQAAHRVTLSVSEELNSDVTLAAVRETGSMKGKSQWVNDAIIGFLDDPGWMDALEADRIAGKDKHITLVISDEVYPILFNGVRKLLEEKPMARHPQNQIIRGAMIWRLLGLDSRPLRKKMAEMRAQMAEIGENPES